MKNFFSIFKKEEIKTRVKEVVSRFPLAFCISIIVTVLFFSMIAGVFSNLTEEYIGRVIFSGIITFFLSAGVSLYSESEKKKTSFYLFLHFAVVVFGLLVFFFLSADLTSFENMVFFLLTLFGTLSFLLFSPYVKHLRKTEHSPESYYVYFYKICVVIFISWIVGGALALLGNIAILSVHELFDLQYSFSGDIHAYWTTLALSFLTPIFALSQLPVKESFEESYFNENAFFNFLIRYVAIPFIYIYFFILYAYTVKVLLNFSDWPKGEVTWMVIGFSLFGYITYMFSYIFECGKKKEVHKLIQLFRKYFPYAVIPQVAMLFYAIGIRIGQYDITTNRYFVVVFGLWLFITSLYLIISSKKSLLYIPAGLTLFTIIISIGPWSVYHLPATRQAHRLEKNLVEANILQGDTIVALEKKSDISAELGGQIYDGIKYVCDFNDCNKVKKIFPDIYSKILEEDKKDWANTYYQEDEISKYPGLHKWDIISGVTKELKVERYYNSNNSSNQTTYYIHNEESLFPLDVSGYENILRIDSYLNNSDFPKGKIDMKNNILKIYTDKEKFEEINIETIVDSLRSNYNDSLSGKYEKNKLTFDIESKSYIGKIIIDSASILQTKDTVSEDYYSTHLSGYLLIKGK